MPEDEEPAFLKRVAKLDQLVLTPGIVDQQQDLRSPELDMLLTQSEEVFPDLMIDEALTNVAPRLGWRGVMNQ
jgi:hypothetical protein